MYYEEKFINGILHSRGTPNGEFEPVTAAILTSMLTAARGRIRQLEALVDAHEEAAVERGWPHESSRVDSGAKHG